MNKNIFLKASVVVAAAGLSLGSSAFAVNTTTLAERICGNNGGGNGNEVITEVAIGVPAGTCIKFQGQNQKGDVISQPKTVNLFPGVPNQDPNGMPGNDEDVDPNAK